MLETTIGIIVFIFGAIIGSFLNVVILRYRSGRTLGGRSMCMTCSKTLTAFELIPIASFVTQRGKCAGCRAPISSQYVIVEVLTGFLFVFLYYRLEYLIFSSAALFGILFAYYAFLISLLIVLSVYDIKHKILPDGLTVLFAAVTFIGTFFLVEGDIIALHIPAWSQILAGIILPAPFSFLWLVSKGKWMGLGDAKLMVGIGFLLGLIKGITAVLLAFWIGAVVGVLLMLISKAVSKKKTTLATAIPFGPFLALGTVLVILFDIDMASIMNFVSAISPFS